MSAPLDPRARRSRTALETALRELLTDRPLAQISIADVTKRADVNRSTFYEHYTDLADLTAAACTAVFEELIATSRLSRPLHGQPVPNPLPRLFAHVADHAHLYRTLLGPDGSARVINHLLDRIATTVHDRRGTTSRDPAAVFLAGAVLGAVIDWLRRDCPDTPEQIGSTYWPHLLAAATAGQDAPEPDSPSNS